MTLHRSTIHLSEPIAKKVLSNNLPPFLLFVRVAGTIVILMPLYFQDAALSALTSPCDFNHIALVNCNSTLRLSAVIAFAKSAHCSWSSSISYSFIVSTNIIYIVWNYCTPETSYDRADKAFYDVHGLYSCCCCCFFFFFNEEYIAHDVTTIARSTSFQVTWSLCLCMRGNFDAVENKSTEKVWIARACLISTLASILICF